MEPPPSTKHLKFLGHCSCSPPPFHQPPPPPPPPYQFISPSLSHIKSIIMSTSARRRLLRDFRRLQGDPPSGVTGAPMDTNIMLWQAVIFGPDDTPWEGGTFKLVLEFTEDYPNKAPAVRFLTKMFHPNICKCVK